jgi:hypothetical protein
MNVEIGAEAALFPEKEYIKWIFVAGFPSSPSHHFSLSSIASSLFLVNLPSFCPNILASFTPT